MARSCHRHLAGKTVFLYVVPHKSDKFYRTVVELLGRGGHVDPLVQDIPRLFPEEWVLVHGEEDLYPHHMLFRVLWDRR